MSMKQPMLKILDGQTEAVGRSQKVTIFIQSNCQERRRRQTPQRMLQDQAVGRRVMRLLVPDTIHSSLLRMHLRVSVGPQCLINLSERTPAYSEQE